MTLAEKVIQVAASQVGVHEQPWGSNSGPRVRTYQAITSLGGTGWPWCAAFVEWVWAHAGVDTRSCSPSTYVMCERAGSFGWFSAPAPGAAIIWCGTHTGIVVSVDRARGVVHTIEGNSGDAVSRRVRSITGARFIVPPGLGGAAAAPEPALSYWLEDPAARPKLHGPWRLRAWRDRAYERLAPATKRTARKVRAGKGYGILSGHRRLYGPWQHAADRDSARTRLEQRLGRRLRPFRRGEASTAAATPLGKTT